MTGYRHTGDVKDRAKNGCPRKNPIKTDNIISGMAARRRFVTANGIRANVQNPRLSDPTIIICLHEHVFGSRRPMKVPQRTDRHELVIGHLRDQLGRAVCVRLTPNHNLGHLRQFLLEELAMIPQPSITTLVGSMRKRLAECIASHGGPTHYWNRIPINDKSWRFTIIIFTYLPTLSFNYVSYSNMVQ